MPSTVWKGQLTFGLVSIPVKLYRAARAEKIRFHHLYRSAAPAPGEIEADFEEEPEPEPAPKRGKAAPVSAPAPVPVAPPAEPEDTEEPEFTTSAARVEQRAFAPDENRYVPRSEIVKGFEYEKDRYVVVDKNELKRLQPKTSREMEIIEFVRLSEIDPVYLETSYYLVPDRNGEKAYAMLFGALRETGYVALARVAMHNREHVVILRPGSHGIILHTMFYTAEIRQEYEFRADTAMVSRKEHDLAVLFVNALAHPFEPGKYKDTYREQVEAMIAAKLQGRETAEPAAPARAPVIDIVKALEQSLAAMRKPPAAVKKPAKRARRA